MPDVGELFVRIRPAPGTQAALTSEASGPVAGAARDLSKVFLAAFAIGGIATTIKSVITAATEHQSAFAVLNQTVRDAGAQQTIYGQSIESLLEKEARLKGFTDEQLASSFTRLVSATKNSETAFKDLGLAEDVARARHISVEQAALAVSKAEQGVSTALQRLGIIVPKVTENLDALKARHEAAIISGAKFTDQQKAEYAAAEKVAQAQDKAATRVEALAVIQQRFGGTATTFANTAAGQFSRLQADFHQFEVAVGTGLLSSLAGAAEGLGKFFTAASQDQGVKTTFETIGQDARTVLGDIKSAAETVGPPLLAVASAAEKVSAAIGAPAIIAAIATYKALGVVQTANTAVQAFYARAVAASTGATAAQAGEATTDAEAVSALTAALVANTAALEADNVVAAETVTIYGALGGEIATVTVANQALAASEVEVAAAGEAAAVGGLGAFVSGIGELALGAAGGPIGLAILGTAALAGGLVYLATRESGAARATNELVGAVRDLASAEQALPGDRLAVAEDKLAIKRDQNALATSNLNHNSLEYHQLLLNLVSDSLNLDSAQQALQKGLQTTAADFETAKQKADALATAVVTAQVLESGAANARVRSVTGQAAPLNAPQRTAAADTFATGIQKTLDTSKNLSPILTHNLQLLEQFALVYGHVPTAKQINLILGNRDATIGLDDIRRKVEGLPAVTAAAAEKASTAIASHLNAGLVAAASKFGLGTAVEGLLAGLPAQVAPEATFVGGQFWTLTEQGIVAQANALGIGDVVKQQLAAAADAAGPNAKAAGASLGADLLTGFAAEVFPGFNSIMTQIDAEIAAGKKAAAEKQLNLQIDPLKQTIAGDQQALSQLQQQATDTAVQGAQALTQAIDQAKQNLNSIGQSIAQTLFDYIDKPLQDAATRISDLQAKITLLNDKRSLATLGEEVILPGDRRLSSDPAKAISQLEALQKTKKSPALDAYVLQFRSLALQVQGDKNTIQTNAANLVKTAAQTRLANLTDLFNTHRISQDTLERDVTALLAKNGLTARTARTRGAAFADTLAGELSGFKQQATANATGPNQPGSGLVPSIVRPIDTLNATQKSLAGIASQERSKQLNETKTQTKLLQKIHASQAAAYFTSSLTHNPGGRTKRSKTLVGVGG